MAYLSKNPEGAAAVIIPVQSIDRAKRVYARNGRTCGRIVGGGDRCMLEGCPVSVSPSAGRTGRSRAPAPKACGNEKTSTTRSADPLNSPNPQSERRLIYEPRHTHLRKRHEPRHP